MAPNALLKSPITRIAWDIPRSKQKDGRLIGLDGRKTRQKSLADEYDLERCKYGFRYDTAGDSLRNTRILSHSYDTVQQIWDENGQQTQTGVMHFVWNVFSGGNVRLFVDSVNKP